MLKGTERLRAHLYEHLLFQKNATPPSQPFAKVWPRSIVHTLGKVRGKNKYGEWSLWLGKKKKYKVVFGYKDLILVFIFRH